MSLLRDKVAQGKCSPFKEVLDKVTPTEVFVRSVVAGGATGALNISIVYPTEFVKTQLQLDEGKKVLKAHSTVVDLTQKSGYKSRATKLLVDTIKIYSGSKDVVKKTIENKGFRGMYKGCSILMMGSVPMYAVRFGVFDALKDKFADENGNLSMTGRLGCGLAAGVAEAVLVVTWTETLKVRMISDQKRSVPKYNGMFHAMRTIVKQEGFGGLYKGVNPTVIKQGSNQAIRFSVMESLKTWYMVRNDKKCVPKYMVCLFGAIAGASSVMGNNPIDVVKTRVQNGVSKNSLSCAKEILTKEGVRGFYRGCLPRLNRVTIEVALAFVIFDSVVNLINKVTKR